MKQRKRRVGNASGQCHGLVSLPSKPPCSTAANYIALAKHLLFFFFFLAMDVVRGLSEERPSLEELLAGRVGGSVGRLDCGS